jgi:ribosomal protein S18 acetylase RimI-like enzyme
LTTAASDVSCRRFEPSEWRLYRDLRLRSLGDSPDAFGSTLAREQGQTDEFWATRLRLGKPDGLDLPLVTEMDGEAAGLAWGRIEVREPEVAHVYQMWVGAEWRGRGAARMLLDEIIRWSRANEARFVRLDVALQNSPAVLLYERSGFEPIGDPHPLRPGSPIDSQEMQLVL